MREFGKPISLDEREEVLALAQAIYDAAGPKRAVKAEDFAMDEEPERVVVHEIDLKWDGQRMRIAATEPNARPPFEWLVEITSDVGDSDYFKHYLVRDEDIVLAQRKVLTPIDREEADIILSDLREAKEHIKK
jgi:hypothetical protein